MEEKYYRFSGRKYIASYLNTLDWLMKQHNNAVGKEKKLAYKQVDGQLMMWDFIKDHARKFDGMAWAEYCEIYYKGEPYDETLRNYFRNDWCESYSIEYPVEE